MASMYEQLMALPLFQGVSSERLSALVEKYPFHFLKFRAGEVIVEPDQPCTHVQFVVSGAAMAELRHRKLQVVLRQLLPAPNVLAPHHLFGLETSYPFGVTAHGECGVLQLRKSDYVSMVQADKVFLFNILNYLSLHTQRLRSSLLTMSRGSVVEHLAIYVGTFTTQLSQQVSLEYRQRDLCALLGVQRSVLTRTLDDLEQQGIVAQQVGVVEFLDLPGLLALALE